jgi:hypothetical protein
MNPKELQELEEKRRQILREREDLRRRFEENEERLRREVISRLTIKDRLMRRLQTKTIRTVLEDDLGSFIIETRLMTSEEMARALELDKMLREAGENPEKYVEAMKGFRELLADLCVTPNLGPGFWLDPGCPATDDVVVAIVLNTAAGAAVALGEAIRNVRKFRGHP